jgi:hypothetical protein
MSCQPEHDRCEDDAVTAQRSVPWASKLKGPAAQRHFAAIALDRAHACRPFVAVPDAEVPVPEHGASVTRNE